MRFNNRKFETFTIPSLGKPYAKYFRDIKLLKQYVSEVEEEVSNDRNVRSAYEELQGIVSIIDRKPNLCLLGGFDAGKSTLANTLLGSEKLPAKISPHTAIPTVVRHIDDRPKGMNKEFYLLNSFLPLPNWNSEDDIERATIDSGSIDLLKKYTHKIKAKKLPKGAMGISFINSPLLTTCNIVDFPGYGHDDDSDSAQKFELLADLVFYLSPINGFIKAEDIFRLGQVVQHLGDYENASAEYPILGNLYILATHADPKGYDSEDIDIVYDSSSSRIIKELGEYSIKDKSKRISKNISKNDIESRLFLFWRRKREVSGSFMGELSNLLMKELPSLWRKTTDKEILLFKDRLLPKISDKLDSYQKRLDQLEKMEEVYGKYEKNEPERQRILKQKVDAISSKIESFSDESVSESRRRIEVVISESKLEEIIRSRYSKKKEAESYALGHIFELIKEEVKEILEPKTKHIVKKTEVFIKEYQDDAEFGDSSTYVGLSMDEVRSFLKGAAKVGTLGALTSLGLAYGGGWLAANATGVLAAVGVGAANVGVAVASAIAYTVSALTGPIGLAIISGIYLFAFFRAPWQERLAKELRKKLLDERISEKIQDGIREYWNSTNDAFLSGVEEMERQRSENMEELRQQIIDPTKGEAEIKRILDILNKAQNFLKKIPWRS